VLALSYQLLAQLTAVKTMLLQRRDRLHVDEIRGSLKDSADRIASALVGSTAPQPASAPPSDETSSPLPDPFEQDLSPWLLRRLDMAAAVATSLRAQAAQVH
jgi:hypothetical protein